ncbi:hypothetical protein DMA15_30865 [Streptomyces sp. WAC 01529]|nr:hypothetical protein DMA15_30865 [Streptomyces sp. WAC 01529]
MLVSGAALTAIGLMSIFVSFVMSTAIVRRFAQSALETDARATDRCIRKQRTQQLAVAIRPARRTLATGLLLATCGIGMMVLAFLR